MKTLKEIVRNPVDPTARGQRNQRLKKIVVEVSMNNEGHPFYTDYISLDASGRKIDIGPVLKKFKKAVDALKKNVPAGTWSITVDGKEV